MAGDPIVPTSLSSGAVVDRGLRLLRSQVWRILAGVAVVILPTAAVDYLVFGAELPVFALVAGPMATLVVICLAEGALRRGTLPLVATLRRAVSRLFLLAVTYLVLAICLILVALPGGIVVAILITVFANSLDFGMWLNWNEPADLLGPALALVALIPIAVVTIGVPVAYLVVRWQLAPIVLLLENQGPVASLTRAWDLSRHAYWHSFMVMAAYSMVSFAVVYSPAIMASLVSGILFATDEPAWYQGLTTALSRAGGVVEVAIEGCVLLVLYYDLRARHEAYDLELKVAALERAAAALPQSQPARSGAP